MLLTIRAENVDNLRTITQERNMETRQMAPFFSSTLYALTARNIHFVLENADFHVVPNLIHSGL